MEHADILNFEEQGRSLGDGNQALAYGLWLFRKPTMCAPDWLRINGCFYATGS